MVKGKIQGWGLKKKPRPKHKDSVLAQPHSEFSNNGAYSSSW